MCVCVPGAIMEQLSKRLLDLNLCDFKPRHSNNLANEFRCFANYGLDQHVKNKEEEEKKKS